MICDCLNDDEFNEAKRRNNFKSITDIIIEMQNKCDFKKLITTWDTIYYSKQTNYERLYLLNKYYDQGYFNVNYNNKKSKNVKKNI